MASEMEKKTLKLVPSENIRQVPVSSLYGGVRNSGESWGEGVGVHNINPWITGFRIWDFSKSRIRTPALDYKGADLQR